MRVSFDVDMIMSGRKKFIRCVLVKIIVRCQHSKLRVYIGPSAAHSMSMLIYFFKSKSWLSNLLISVLISALDKHTHTHIHPQIFLLKQILLFTFQNTHAKIVLTFMELCNHMSRPYLYFRWLLFINYEGVSELSHLCRPSHTLVFKTSWEHRVFSDLITAPLLCYSKWNFTRKFKLKCALYFNFLIIDCYW